MILVGGYCSATTMFQMRKVHEEAFQRAAIERFEYMAEEDLRLHHPNESAGLTHEDMRSFIHDGICQAARFRLATEYAVLCFLHIRLRRGPRWGDGEDGKALRELLLRGSCDQNERAEQAVNYLFREQS